MPKDHPWSPPYLGAAYYPEDWPLEQIDDDIALMKQAGMNVMRVGEFAWSSMEPKEGVFDFDWLHLAVDKLSAAGIATVMCTPTCTPPAWLVERYPETLFVDPNGRPASHGGRRHACPISPVYRAHCERIVTKMAEEFGHDDRIIGWQIDNEVYPHGSRACCCPACVSKFQDDMRKRFGTIEALNEAWCTTLWSQTYSSFSQLPVPRGDIWHHPSLLAAWDQFNSRSYVEFVEHQADILHRLTDHPIGTDMMMILGIDHYDMNRNLDIVQYNHYHFREGLWQAAFWFDYIRPIKDKPFWNTETSTCWGGGTDTSGYCEPGFCRANSWMPIAMGGEANLYWLWRSHWAGQELMHGSVVSSTGRPMHIFDEVKEIAEGFKASADFVNGTKPSPTGMAVHFSHTSNVIFKDQPLVHGFDYLGKFLERVYRPLIGAQYRPDVIDPSVDLAEYKLVLSPFLPTLDESGVRDRLKSWIEAGGTWVVGPFSDIRTIEGTKFTRAPYGSLEEWGGVYCRYQLPGEPRDFGIKWQDGTESKGSLWYDCLEPRDSEPLAVYTEGPGAGLAAATIRPMGKGRVIVLGTLPTQEDLLRMLGPIAADAGVTPVADASENLLVVPRSGPAGQGLILVEFENRPARIALTRQATDLLTGRVESGEVEIPPYGVKVLKY